MINKSYFLTISTTLSYCAPAPIFSILHSLLIFPLIFRKHTQAHPFPTIRPRCNCGKIVQINHPPFAFPYFLSFGAKLFPDKKIHHTHHCAPRFGRRRFDRGRSFGHTLNRIDIFAPGSKNNIPSFSADRKKEVHLPTNETKSQNYRKLITQALIINLIFSFRFSSSSIHPHPFFCTQKKNRMLDLRFIAKITLTRYQDEQWAAPK